MQPLSSDDIRASFVNCSAGRAKRLPLPPARPDSAWADLDFLGWRDPGAPGSAFLVVERDGRPVGVEFKIAAPAAARGRKNMCAFCLTTHSSTDMALMVAARPGAAGRAGNTVGTYLCGDLGCSLYARGLKRPDRAQPHETLSAEAKVERLRANLDTFLRRLLAKA